MKKNKKNTLTTYENGKASKINAFEELERTVCACLLWEDGFYENGISVSERIQTLINSINDNQKIIDLIKKAKFDMKLRHCPLYMISCLLAKGVTGLKDLIEEIVTRPDDMGELLALYKTNNYSLSNSIKKGLAKAFTKFDEFQLAKWNRKAEYNLVDIANLCHPKPTEAINKLMNGTLKTPETWEVLISEAGSDIEKKKNAWEKLLLKNKIPDMAFLKNIAGISRSGVDKKLIKDRISKISLNKLLPIDYIRAGIMNPNFESEIEKVFLKNMSKNKDKISGKTLILVDVSGSMECTSKNSKFSCLDYACSLAMIGREISEYVEIWTFSQIEKLVPSRRGFALRDAINYSQGHWGTNLGESLNSINKKTKYDRIIIITDEQTSDTIPNAMTEKSYIINVSTCQRGVGYKQGYIHISGFSDSVFDYIKEIEKK